MSQPETAAPNEARLSCIELTPASPVAFGVMLRALYAVLGLWLAASSLVACGQVEPVEWREVGVVQVTDNDACWNIDGPNRATSALDTEPEDVTGGPKTWAGGAEILVWSSDDSDDLRPLSYTPTACPSP